MTEEQIYICRRFGGVKFLPGSWDKRIARYLHRISTEDPQKELSEKLADNIFRLLFRYRRQLPDLFKKFNDHPKCKIWITNENSR